MIALKMRTSKPVLAREHGSVFCEIDVIPGEGKPARRRSPVAFVLCLDRSGSMAGVSASQGRHREGRAAKIQHARIAAEQAIGQLLDDDSVGLVSFSTEARVDIPLTRVSPEMRSQLIARIREIAPEEATNLADGISMAAGLFGPSHRKERPCKIVVLSDGLANVGLSEPLGLAGLAREYSAAGITVSTIGVGEDYSAETMSGIAQAGGGEFYHVSDSAEIETAVYAEIGDIKAVAARQARLRLQVPPLVALGANLNLLPQQDVPGGILVELGDVVRPRQVMVEVASPVDLPGDHIAIAVECRYMDPETGREAVARGEVSVQLVPMAVYAHATPDPEVTLHAEELIKARAVRLATTAYERDDLKTANKVLREAVVTLSDTSHGWMDAPRAVDDLKDMSDRISDRQMGAGEVKTFASAAYAVSTSRPAPAARGKSRP